MEKMREEFENSVIVGMRESGFLGVEVRVERLGLAPDGSYLDGTVNAWWDFWQASRAALCVELPRQWFDDEHDCDLMEAHKVGKAIESTGVRYT